MVSSYCKHWSSVWNQFWFRPADPTVLGLMRVLVGTIVFYSHLVWSRELTTVFGPTSLIPSSARAMMFDNPQGVWSHLDWVSRDTSLWVVHVLGLIIVGMFTIGLFTRVTSVLSFLLVISYANGATGMLFGLDQINGFLCLYLALGKSGACFSFDHWLRLRRQSKKGGGGGPAERVVAHDVLSNVAIRLIQCHMCVVYLFAGIGKLQGETWLNGTAVWYSLASYEYQTLDMTWLAEQMWLVNVITLVALAWEVSYAFLIWPRLTRPIFLALAVAVHLGIGLAMGMMTFGLIMIVGNFAFLPPEWLNRFVRRRRDDNEPDSVVAQT